MAPKHRIIIDTDPGKLQKNNTVPSLFTYTTVLTYITGVDDVLAILLALSASPEDLEVAMISVTYGNVPLQG